MEEVNWKKISLFVISILALLGLILSVIKLLRWQDVSYLDIWMPILIAAAFSVSFLVWFKKMIRTANDNTQYERKKINEMVSKVGGRNDCRGSADGGIIFQSDLGEIIYSEDYFNSGYLMEYRSSCLQFHYTFSLKQYPEDVECRLRNWIPLASRINSKKIKIGDTQIDKTFSVTGNNQSFIKLIFTKDICRILEQTPFRCENKLPRSKLTGY